DGPAPRLADQGHHRRDPEDGRAAARGHTETPARVPHSRTLDRPQTGGRIMNLFHNPLALGLTRRHFFRSTGFSLGATALAALQAQEARAAARGSPTGLHAALKVTHFPAKCKQVIYLHM